MDNGNIGGLTGRARKVRERNRSHRMHTQQLIEEYLDPATLRLTRHRRIPIRVRRDHTLTGNRAGPPAISSSSAQPDLPWTQHQQSGEANRLNPNETFVMPAPDANGDAPNKSRLLTIAREKIMRLVDRFDDGRYVRRAVALLTDNESAPAFSPRRFAAGCLVGSAAAVVILLAAISVF